MIKTVSSLLKTAEKKLLSISDTPRLDAELLLGHILGKERFELFIKSDYKVTNKEYETFKKLIDHRLSKVPVAYILKKKPFFEDVFYVDERVLIPRPETELLVEDTIKQIKTESKSSIDILDLCCGSGCIGISIFKMFSGTLTLADKSVDALEVTDININKILPQKQRNITLIQSDLFNNINGSYDLITCNPPYLSQKDMSEIQNTPVAHEPSLALAGGKTGFEISAKIISQAHTCLKDDGYLFMELGFEGANFLDSVSTPLILVDIIKDYGEIDRIAVWKK